jgi:putative endonuclease
MNNTETGKIGENMACAYLRKNKYLILARNHKERFDEIDIIARHFDGTLIFCEVKSINDNSLNCQFMPEDNLSALKFKKMVRAANMFLSRHPGAVREGVGWRIDLIAIVLRNGELASLRHYKNI